MIKAFTYLYFPFGIAAVAAIILIFFGRIPDKKALCGWRFCAAIWLFMLSWRLICGAISSRYYENLLFLTTLLVVFSIGWLWQTRTRFIMIVAVGALAIVMGIAIIKNLRSQSVPAYLQKLATVLQAEFLKDPRNTIIFDETGNLRRMGYLIDTDFQGIPVPDSSTYLPDKAGLKIREALKTVFSHGDRLLYVIKPLSKEWWEENVVDFCKKNGFSVTCLKEEKYRGKNVAIYEILPAENHWPLKSEPKIAGEPVWTRRDFGELKTIKRSAEQAATQIIDSRGNRRDLLLKNWTLWSNGWGSDTRIILPDSSDESSAFSVKCAKTSRWNFYRTFSEPGKYVGFLRCAGLSDTSINIELVPSDMIAEEVNRILLSAKIRKNENQYFRFEFEIPNFKRTTEKLKFEVKINGKEFAISQLCLFRDTR